MVYCSPPLVTKYTPRIELAIDSTKPIIERTSPIVVLCVSLFLTLRTIPTIPSIHPDIAIKRPHGIESKFVYFP